MENTSCCFKKFTPFFFHLEQIFFAIIAAIYKYLPNEISCPLLGKLSQSAFPPLCEKHKRIYNTTSHNFSMAWKDKLQGGSIISRLSNEKNADVRFFVKRKGIISMEIITYINNVIHKNEKQKSKTKRLPMRSTVTEFPSTSEKPNNTQGNKGALNVNKPKKFIRT